MKPYDIIKNLSSKLGEQEARDLVEFVEEKVEAREKDIVTRVELKDELQALRSDLMVQIQSLRTEIQTIKTDVQIVKFDFLKWLFGFWITLLLVILFKEYFIK